MAKPKAIQWLEEQTGETIAYTPEVIESQDRHLSVRLAGDLAASLDSMAAERGLRAGGAGQPGAAALLEAMGKRLPSELNADGDAVAACAVLRGKLAALAGPRGAGEADRHAYGQPPKP